MKGILEVPQPNKENIRKWVEALRSGKFQQTNGALRDLDGYCCLGVACEVSGLGYWANAPHKDKETAESEVRNGSQCFVVTPATIVELSAGDRLSRVYEGGDYQEEFLPDGVKEWLGVESVNPDMMESINLDSVKDSLYTTLAALNDDEKWDFNQIADAIERKYLSEERV